MKKTILMGMLVAGLNANSQSYIDLPVWPNGAKQDNGLVAEETTTPDGSIAGSKEARMYVYLPEQNAGAKRKAVLVCPGGGYSHLAIKHEGHDVARWLNTQGVVAVVLKYRMPNHHSEIPLSDASEAMRIIRRHAAEWNIDTLQVGVCGFSAGGHLASTLSTHADASALPNFAILFYPVISMKDGVCHQGSRNNLLQDIKNADQLTLYSNELQVSKSTPPTLLILADNDKSVIPENSILYYQALKKNGIAASMSVFPTGGHGFGFRTNYKYHEPMKQVFSDWLKVVK